MQLNMFDFEDEKFKKFKFKNKPVNLIEFYAGYGSQKKALDYEGISCKSHCIVEWYSTAICEYKNIHLGKDIPDYSKNKTKQEIANILFDYGISKDTKEPATIEQIKRTPEHKLRDIYNSIIATNNLVNVFKVKGEDLKIINTKEEDYMLTYSFPCQDLSLAGKGKGMAKGSGTRSGTLWELERILKECKELPQVLLMENVTQVSGKKHFKDFTEWCDCLKALGYSNNYKNLIATEYGTEKNPAKPQTRNRTFMVSTLNSKYEFPKKMELQCKLKDFLEDEVDEKFFLSEAMIKYVCSRMPSGENKITTMINMSNRIDSLKAGTITCGEGSKSSSNYIIENKDVFYSKKEGCLLIPEDTKKGYAEATTTYPYHLTDLRIRKLTPKECGRLMGVKDEDIEKMECSDAEKYKLFGNSICTNVLAAIFKEMM